MILEMHAMISEFLPIGLPPAFHGWHLILQSCDDDDDWDLLPTYPRVENIVVPGKGTTDSRTAHTVHQEANAI